MRFDCGVEGGPSGECGDCKMPSSRGTWCAAARSFWSMAAPPRVRGISGRQAPCHLMGWNARSRAVHICDKITGSREKRSTDQSAIIAERITHNVGGGTEVTAAQSMASVCWRCA